MTERKLTAEIREGIRRMIHVDKKHGGYVSGWEEEAELLLGDLDAADEEIAKLRTEVERLQTVRPLPSC